MIIYKKLFSRNGRVRGKTIGRVRVKCSQSLIHKLTTTHINHKSAQKCNESYIYIFHLIRVPLSFLLAHGLGHLVAIALKTRSLLNTSEVTQWKKQTMDFTSHRNITTRPHSVLRLPEHVCIKNK